MDEGEKQESKPEMNPGNGNSKILWWVIGIAVVLVVGYFIFSSLGGDSGSVSDSELQAEIDEIPQTGEGLIDDSVVDESDDVDLGEDLI